MWLKCTRETDQDGTLARFAHVGEPVIHPSVSERVDLANLQNGSTRLRTLLKHTFELDVLKSGKSIPSPVVALACQLSA